MVQSGAKRLRVALLFGGRSGEHEVSAISARHVAQAMDSGRYEVIPIAISKKGQWLLPDASRKVLEGGSLEIPEHGFQTEGEPVTVHQDPTGSRIVPVDPSAPAPEIAGIDVVFPVLHGPYGEDGTVQGLLELADIPYVGAGVLGSALGMDKEKMKILFRDAGLPTAEFKIVRESEWLRDRKGSIDRAQPLAFPCFTKPANLGSSVGITKCKTLADLERGIEAALVHDRKILVEEAVSGREIECGVLGNDDPQVSVCGEIIPGREFYDYAAKYIDDASRALIPADLPPEITETIQEFAVKAFKAVEAEGMARVDFFYGDAGRGVVVSEINTIPGFTQISMFPKLWEASGMPYNLLIDRLIELALERHARKRRPEDITPPKN